MMKPPLATDQLRPGLVARDIGGHHVTARHVERLGFGQDGRNENRAGMAAQRNIIEIERMGRGAVDPGRLRSVGLLLAEIQRGVAGTGIENLAQNAGRLLLTACDHDADTVDEPVRAMAAASSGTRFGDKSETN